MTSAHRTTARVRYGETDQMGFAYHANYVAWFEIGRTERMRDGGLCYAEMERAGLALAVAELGVRYLRPAFYDEVLQIETRLVAATGVRLRFEYRILRAPGPGASPGAAEEVLCEGHTVLACLGRGGRPTRIPAPFDVQIAALAAADART